MKILEVFALRGPNFWSRRTVLEAWVDLEELKDSPSNTLPGLYERLTAWLPGLIEHRCGLGVRGGFLERLRDGTYPAHVLEHVSIELENLAGTPVGFGKARETSTPGIYKVAIRYKDETVGRACLQAGFELLTAAINDKPFDVAGTAKRLKELAEDVCLGPSTAAIVSAAEARNIPSRRLNRGSLVQLGHGARQRRVWTAETDHTSAIAEAIASDKELTKELLRSAGVPVPTGRAVESAADAWAAACEIGLPVVVKPRDGNHGRAVFTDLSTAKAIDAAYVRAREEGSGVLVEQFIRGNEHRLLVVGEKLVAASCGETACVTGDGEHTVEQLIALQLNSSPLRGPGDECPLNAVDIDSVVRLELERQGLATDAVPPAGVKVLIQRNGNVANDVTDRVHPSTAAQMVLAAKIVGLDIAGIDLVAEDIARPLAEQRGAVIEVNSSPGLLMHLMPASGKPRPVGEAIVDRLFAAGDTGRIPIVCVTGTNGKTLVTRLVAHILRGKESQVGMACSDGVYIDGRVVDRGDCAGPASARRLLLNPMVQAAVFEAGRGGILREGLGFDRCDVAVVTNIGEADHLGQRYIDTADDMFTVKRCPVDVVLPTGTAVLNAADPLVAGMAELSAGRVTFFAIDPTTPVLITHRTLGKRVVFVADGHIHFAEGESQTIVADLNDVPLTHQGRVRFQVENALAAAGAAWALGIAVSQIQNGLATFNSDVDDCPGRFNVIDHQGATFIIDDCHNASGLTALMTALAGFAATRRTVVYSAGKGRRDQDIVTQGQRLAQGFDRVILYDDTSAEDRTPGEVRALLHRGLACGGRVADILDVPNHYEAVGKAIELTSRGELTVLQPQDSGISPTVDLVEMWIRLTGQKERAGGGWS
jgi:cyanophycin synthetase